MKNNHPFFNKATAGNKSRSMANQQIPVSAKDGIFLLYCSAEEAYGGLPFDFGILGFRKNAHVFGSFSSLRVSGLGA